MLGSDLAIGLEVALPAGDRTVRKDCPYSRRWSAYLQKRQIAQGGEINLSQGCRIDDVTGSLEYLPS